MRKLVLRIFGLIGIGLFVPLFIFTFVHPHSIEKAGKAFIEWKLENSAEQKIDAIGIPGDTKLGALLNKAAGEKLEIYKAQLREELPRILSEQISLLANLSCECRQNWEQRLANSLRVEIVTLETAMQKVTDFTQAKYMAIVNKLTRDIRVFLGVNSTVFLLLILLSFVKPNAIIHLFLPGVLLLVSTLFCSYFYLFEQNWFFTIIYEDYTGFTYLAYLLGAFSFLADIALNRGRVTTNVLNVVGSVFDGAFQVLPC